MTPTLRRVAVLALGVGLLTATTAVPAYAAPRRKPVPVSPNLVKVAVPAAGTSYLGAFTPSGPYSPATMDSFTTAAGRRPSVVMWFQSWGGSGTAFDANAMNTVVAKGAIPMVTWEPWGYSLDAIVAGSADTYVTAWAKAARAWGKPLFLRFAHEMNAPHYPWSEQANGNGAGDYARAWRRVHGLFAAAGAANVSWVWCPALDYTGQTPLTGLYPGAAYVDWVGVDAYNGGTALSWGGWLTFNELFAPTLTKLDALAPGKPQLIGEVASVEQGGSKAAWIADMFAQLANRPAVRSFTWFNEAKEADWRIQSSSSAQTAFRNGAAATRYR